MTQKSGQPYHHQHGHHKKAKRVANLKKDIIPFSSTSEDDVREWLDAMESCVKL